MIFYVFSYNRSRFLENCIRSIEECAPGSRVVIHDDRSEDPETRAVLKRCTSRHTVVSGTAAAGTKHGGLYANMQQALESAAADEVVCFLQDDTQLVRRLSAGDETHIRECFERMPDLGFVSPAFIRGISLRPDTPQPFDYDPDTGLFFSCDTQRSAGVYYSDVFVSIPARLRAHGWRFAIGEPANQRRAAADFRRMGYLRCPFLMWLPYGSAYRGKRKTLALRYAERRRRCGFYPLRYLDAPAVQRLRTDSPAPLPIAETFLQPVHGELKHPWIYDPLQGARLLKHLSRAELYLRVLFSRKA